MANTLCRLPDDIIRHIDTYLNNVDRLCLRATCKMFGILRHRPHGVIKDAKKCTRAGVLMLLGKLQYRIQNDIAACAAKTNNLELLSWALFHKYPADYRAYTYAIKHNSELMIKCIVRYGLPLTPAVFADAVQYGTLALMNMLFYIKCPTDAAACTRAAALPDPAKLEWLIQHGCLIDSTAVQAAVRPGSSIHNLPRLICHGAKLTMAACTHAAIYANIPMLDWLRQNNCPMDPNVCLIAAYYGHVAVLEWGHARQFVLNATVCINAARRNHLHIIKCARKHNCDWDERVCAYAARNRDLATLQWCHANGCPWNAATCVTAAAFGNLPMITWLIGAGCPVNHAVYEAAIMYNQPHILAYLHTHFGSM